MIIYFITSALHWLELDYKKGKAITIEIIKEQIGRIHFANLKLDQKGDNLMIPKRVKNYVMIILLYGCSLYHFVFSGLAKQIGSHIERGIGGFPLDNLLFQNYGVQEYKFRENILPVYGFLTFTLMTCFIIFDYWMIRKATNPRMNLRQFLDAFLFSQLAYVGFIFQLKNHITGIHAVNDGVLLVFIYVPMFIISFPISCFIFNKRIKKIMLVQTSEDEQKSQEVAGDNKDNKKILVDYLIVWFISLICAIISYWASHYR